MMNFKDQNNQVSQAAIFATAFPVPGQEHQWEQALGDLIRTSSTFPGHQGSMVLQPESPDQHYYRVITKFDTHENMRRWYESDEREAKIAQLEPFEQQPAEVQHLTGFETWFIPPESSDATAKAPPKYKMFVVVWIAVYLAVLPMISILKPLTDGIPQLLASALLAATSVAMMTWIVLPLLTKLFQGWLYPKA